MDLSERLEHLLSAAADVGLVVRRESLGGEGGGVCKLRGQRILFVDLSADADTRYGRTLAALADLPEWENRFLPPEIREDLEKARSSA